MNKTWLLEYFFILVIIQFSGNVHAKQLDQLLKKELTQIAISFFTAYEPQNQSIEQAIVMAIEPFTKTDDFIMVIDGRDLGNNQDWNNIVPKSMKRQYEEVKSATHPIETVTFIRLSDNLATLNILYRTYYSMQNGEQGFQDAVVYMIFRKEENSWRIIQYIGSHFGKEHITQKATTSDLDKISH